MRRALVLALEAACILLLVGTSSCAMRPQPVASIGTAVGEEGETPTEAAGESGAGPRADEGEAATAAPQPADPPAPSQEPRPAPEPSPSTAPKLLSEEPSAVEVRAKLDRALEIAQRLDERSLSIEQADLLLAGRQFVSESAEAVAVGDLQRASVLADKALVILQDLEHSTRP